MSDESRKKIGGVIGITDDGFPIVTEAYVCPYWEAGAQGICQMRECWYCKYADFRKSSRITLQQSICRNPRCRVAVEEEIPQRAKNEGAQVQHA